MKREFITLTTVAHHERSPKVPGRRMRFMVRNIVTWATPPNGKSGSIVITNESDNEGGWHVLETPEQIDALIEDRP